MAKVVLQAKGIKTKFLTSKPAFLATEPENGCVG